LPRPRAIWPPRPCTRIRRSPLSRCRRDWFCAGHSLAQSGLAAFWLEIRITEGTNTKDEKAAFIAAVFKRMGELLGPLHENSYVYAHDARADGYGFGGVTSERRYVAGKLGTKLSAAA
jgi:4-oxalocrotonate tautomerase